MSDHDVPPQIREIFDNIFDSIQRMYAETHQASNSLLGIVLVDGKISDVVVVPVTFEMRDFVPKFIEAMLVSFPVVMHVCEAWGAPSAEFNPSEHPEKKDIISFVIYSGSGVYVSTCDADEKKFIVTKGGLFKAGFVGGRMAYQPPTAH